MPQDPRDVDVVVIGGGPAGATAAGLLASWGRSVVLAHRESGQPSLAESLPASTKKLLRFLGQIDAVEAARFHPNFGNRSRWAGKAAVATSADPGYHVPRREFDRRLREHARAQSAIIVDGQVQRVDPGDSARIRVALARGDVVDYSAAFVLDCSGRTGVIARKGLRRFDVGYRTLAVVAEWECDRWPEEEQAHTLVDSYTDGWAWSVPLSPTRRQCTVMIDRERTTITRASLAAVYRAELRKATSIHERLAGARQSGRAWARDASLYSAVRAADHRTLLVGDAASFIDPLSSAGVKKALTSAWRAAVVANTCLETPDMLGAACDFYDCREQQVYRECLRRAAAFFEEAATVHDDAFWTTRARCRPEATFGEAGDLSDQDLRRDSSIRQALERLQAAPALDLTPAPGLRFDMAAVIEGRQVVMREAVSVPGFPSPLRFAVGVNLPELVRISIGCRDVASLIDAYHTRVGEVDIEELLTGLSLLIARGAVRDRLGRMNAEFRRS